MAVNSFLSGFTGGMTAMNQMMDSAEQRQDRRQARDDQSVQRNALTMMHIYNEFSDDQEKLAEFNTGMFNTLNGLPAVKEALAAEYPGAEVTLSGFEPTANGLVPMVSYTNDAGDQVTEPIRMDGQPVALSQDEFFKAIGSQPELLSEARRQEARLIGAGGTVPEKPDQFETFTENGMRLKRNMKTGEETLVGTIPGAGKGGGGDGFEFPDYKSMGPAIELEDGRKVVRYQVGNRVMEYTLNKDGSWGRPKDVTEAHFNPLSSGGNNVRDNFNQQYAGVGNPQQNVPFYDLGNGQVDAGMEEKPAPKPQPKPKPKPKEEAKPAAKPKTTNSPRSSVTGGYQRYQLTDEQEQRAAQARSDYKKQVAEGREEARKKRNKQRQRQQENLSNIRPGGMQQ